MTLTTAGQWTEAPAMVWDKAGSLHVTAKRKSDFWRDPRNGSVTDNGHLLGHLFDSDMSCEVQTSGTFAAAYDQCGLMLRVDAAHWVKVALDLVGRRLRIATVVTNGISDSALQTFTSHSPSCWFRLNWMAGLIVAEARAHRDDPYEVIRLARLGFDTSFLIGPMCCAPTSENFTATFDNLNFGPPSLGAVA